MPSDILFLSDNIDEVGAAMEAHMDSILVERPGNAPVSHHDKLKYGAVDSLDKVHLPALPTRHRLERDSEPEASEDVVEVDGGGEEE